MNGIQLTSDFCHLHVHSEFSILDGYSKVEDIVSTVASMGESAVSLTDHGSLAGSLRFHKAGQENGIKTIQGLEAYVTPDLTIKDKDSPTWHLTLLAMNQEGLNSLFSLSRVGWTEGFYRKPRVDYKTLEKYSGGIIALSGCMGGEVAREIEDENFNQARLALNRYAAIFTNRFYVELQPGNTEGLNRTLGDLASACGLPTTVAIDSHYDKKDNASAQELLLTMQQVSGFPKSIKDYAACVYEDSKKLPLVQRLNKLWPKRKLRFDHLDLHLMSRQEVSDDMQKQGFDGEALCDSTLEIAQRCEQVEFNLGQNYLPKVYQSLNSSDYLRELVWDGFGERNKLFDQGRTEEYKQRIEEELSIISDKNFSDYFLVVYDLINTARNRGIYVGPGRGSAAGALVAFCLGITSIDPIRYDLLFERFIDPERDDYPDIDMDFEHMRRDEMKLYMKERYGEALSVSTFTELKAKGLIRKISSALCIPLEEVNAVSKHFDSLDEYKVSEGTKEFRNRHPEIITYAEKLEGHISASGMHAAAVVVADRPMDSIIPIETRANPDDKKSRVPVCAYEMNDTAEMGLIKFDALGLNTLSVIHTCVDLVRERHDLEIDWEHLEPDDREVLAMVGAGKTIGVFQMDTSPYKKLLIEMGVDSFNDMVASNALVRPGAFLTVAKDYINRKKGREKVTYPHPSVEKYLKDTYGVYIYQEQVMQLAVELGGFTKGEANKLRKIIGKKRDVKEFMPYLNKWMEGATRFISERDAEKIWKDFEKHAGYSFNKSHSVSYSYIGYVTAWLKLKYPLEYIYSLLVHEKKATTRMSYLLEARRLGIEVLSPDVNISSDTISIDKDTLRFGLTDIKGVGYAAYNAINSLRPFSSWGDFVERVPARKCNSGTVTKLAAVNAFASIPDGPSVDNPEDNYTEYLNYPISLEGLEDIGVEFTNLEEYDEQSRDFIYIKGVVKAIKRTPRYVRLEIEDLTGNVTVFGSMTNDLSEGEVIIALIGDKSMVGYCRTTALRDRIVSNHLNSFEEFLFGDIFGDTQKLVDNKIVGDFGEEQALAIPLQVRPFTTKTGKEICFSYLTDGKSIVKTTIFSKEWKSIKKNFMEWHSYGVRLSMIDGGFTLYAEDVIDARDLMKIKKIT